MLLLARRSAAAVAALAEARGVRQTQIAGILGISQPQVSRRLRGQVAFSVDELEKLADLFDVPASRLLEAPEPAQVAS